MTATPEYGGESWAKKGTRAEVWGQIHRSLGRNPKLALVLAGPDNADARCLRYMGVPPSGIVAVDKNHETLSQAKRKVPGCAAFAGDALGAARAFRRRFDAMWLDYCVQLTEKNVASMAQTVSWGASEGCVIACSFSYGRESRSARASLGMASLAHETAKSAMTRAGISDAVWAVGETDACDIESFDAQERRLILFCIWADRAFGRLGITASSSSLSCWSYISRTESKPGTPMLVVLFSVSRKGPRGFISSPDSIMHRASTSIQENAAHVRDRAVEVARLYGSAAAADAFNLDAAQVAAWLAVSTRTHKGDRT